jgi:ribonuclease HI
VVELVALSQLRGHGQGLAVVEVYCDGGRRGGARQTTQDCGYAAVVFREGQEVAHQARYTQGRTNNEMEYAALQLGIDMARAMGERRAVFFCDSRLVVEQVRGNWRIREDRLRPLRDGVVRSAGEAFESASIKWISRDLNRRADELYNEALDLRSDLSHGEAAAVLQRGEPGSRTAEG